MCKQRDLQLVELDILKYVANFCRKNNICYSLYGGTLLGAIRHQGFIPWDDDLDICMSRKDYNTFISLWGSESHNGYIIQNKETDPDFTQSFTKIRKDNTAFIQQEDNGRKYHKGVFIDIFPIDRIPNGFQRGVFKYAVMFYLLCCREFVPSKEKSCFYQRFISSIFLFLFNHRIRARLRKRLLEWITHFNNNSDLSLVSIETLSSLSYVYPSYILDEFTKIDFEGFLFQAWKHNDLALSIRYNDYMKLPPKSEQRWKHSPVYMSLSQNSK